MNDCLPLSGPERWLFRRVLPWLVIAGLCVWLVSGVMRLLHGDRAGVSSREQRVYVLNPLVGSVEELAGLLNTGWRVVQMSTAAASRTELSEHRVTFVCQDPVTKKTSWYSLNPMVQDAPWQEFAQKVVAGEQITLASSSSLPFLAAGYHTVFVLER